MNKRLAWTIVAAGLLVTNPVTNDTGANSIRNTQNDKKQTEIKKTTRNDVLFTIDDGPSEYTLEIAKTLDSLQYQWIFYVVTRGIKESTRKDLVEVIKMWHHIGNHSFSHPNFQTITLDQAKEQILKWDSLIAALYQEAGIPQQKKYIRYPYGNQSPKYYRQEFNDFLDSLGYETPMFWHQNVDLRDYAAAPIDANIARMKPWDTILLHERSRTPQTIERIVQNLDNQKES